MTSTEQINSLISGYTDLKSFFENERDQIAAARAAALGDVAATIDSRMNQTFWVDQATGDDANSGTEAAPFATIQRALSVSPYNGAVNIRLLSAYTVDRINYIAGREVILRSADTANPVALTFAGEASNKAGWMPGFANSNSPRGSLFLSDLDITMGTAAAGVGTRHMIGTFFSISVLVNRCTLRVPAGSDQNLLEVNKAVGLFVRDTTVIGDMAGRWQTGVAAGTDPATVRTIAFTNLASL